MRRWATFAAGMLAGAIVWTTAWAAIPDTSDVIHGCRKSSPPSQVGQLRVIDTEAGQTCTSNEVALTWNQTGPRGATGPQGPAGATGPEGPQGEPGPSGSTILRFREHVLLDDPDDRSKVFTITFTQPADAVAYISGEFSTTCTNGTNVDLFLQANPDPIRLGRSLYTGDPAQPMEGVLYFDQQLSNAGQSGNSPFVTGRPYLFEPGVDTVETINVRVTDACPFILHTADVAINVEFVS
jgi:hypothetical protein